MADLDLKGRPALAGLLVAGRHGLPDGVPGLTIAERTGLSLASVIARKGEVEALAVLVKSAYGLDLPPTPRHAGRLLPDGRAIAFIWAGPAQWLAIGEGMEDFEGELAGVLGKRAMIAEQGDGRCVLRVSGSKARQALAKGLPIDLDPRVFKPGDAAVSLVAHIGVHLWQLDEVPTYEMSVYRSFAGSFWSWLAASAAEFGYEVVER